MNKWYANNSSPGGKTPGVLMVRGERWVKRSWDKGLGVLLVLLLRYLSGNRGLFPYRKALRIGGLKSVSFYLTL